MEDTDLGFAKWGLTWEDAKSPEAPQGEANLQDNHVSLEIPFGHLLGFPGVHGLDEGLPTAADAIYGLSRAGDWLAITGAQSGGYRMSFPGGASQTIIGNYLLAGRSEFSLDDNATGATLKFDGLTEWVWGPCLSLRFDRTTGRLQSLNVEPEAWASRPPIYESDDLDVEVVHIYTSSPLTATGFQLTHGCELSIRLKGQHSLDDVIRLTTPLRTFLQLCTASPVCLQSLDVAFLHEAREVNARCYGTFFDRASTVEGASMPFPLPRIENETGRVLGSLLHASARTDEAAGIISGLLCGIHDLSFDLQFVAAAQALESLARESTSSMRAMPRRKHGRRLKQVLSQLDGQVSQETLKWVQARLQSNAKGQKRLLEELIETHETLANALIPNPPAFVDAYVRRRNQATHRDGSLMRRGKDDLMRFLATYEATLLFAYAIIWSMLGLDDDRVIAGIKECHKWDAALGRIARAFPGSSDA